MKIGIVSQFGFDNYGNKLQNYALQQTLLVYADSVITIKNKSISTNPFDYIKRYTFLAESLLINKMTRRFRKTKFLEFHHEYIKSGKKIYCCKTEYPSLGKKDRCNIYCAGSDQIWKPTSACTGVFHYLGFADYNTTFSYAASFGVDRIPEEYEEDVRRGLQHIKYISVREDSGKRIVEELTGRTDVQVLVDPTMLLTTEQWDRVASKPRTKMPEKYILTYFLGDVPQERAKAIREKAEELDCEVIELMNQDDPFYVSGPGEFAYLIKYAALVCTDSFHGSVFSFLYRRPLVIFDRKGNCEDMSSRIDTFASKFHMESCIAESDRIPKMDLSSDYSAGYAVLEEERKKSKAFLDMVFSEAKKVEICK